MKGMYHEITRAPLPAHFRDESFDDVYAFHRSMPEYAPTRLHSLNAIAQALKLEAVYVKDESTRFGLNAFKGLGASYAVHKLLEKDPSIGHFVTATDGNHGRAVAWSAQRAGRKATVFLPKGSLEKRAENIRSHGAKAVITDMNYDDTVRYAAEFASEQGAALVQDTAFPGYMETPKNIVLGYSTMAREAADALPLPPTHVLLQAGVGSMAGGVTAYLRHRYAGISIRFIILEAENTPCVKASIAAGRAVRACTDADTLMAGLNCGEPNIDILPVLDAWAEWYFECEDAVTLEGMEALHHAGIDAGESGAVGLGALMRMANDETLRARLGFDEHSRVLMFSTEGTLK